MTPLQIQPITTPLHASVAIPGSKSYTNRALIMAAMSQTPVCLHNPLWSEDTEAMIDCLRTLGLNIDTSISEIFVASDISHVEDNTYELFVRDSGTCARFLLALMCVTPGIQILRGNPRLQQRPIKNLTNALRELGAKIEYLEEEGFLPVKILSSHLTGSACTLSSDVSSQYLSALLMIAPLLNALTINIDREQISAPYVDMTIDMMQSWGIQIERKAYEHYHIPAQQTYQCQDYFVEGDFSSAGYFFAIAALTRSTLRLENLNPHSKQADVAFASLLEKMGNKIIYEENAVTICGAGVTPMPLAMIDCPDQIQTMAVLAAFADGMTEISGIKSLRLKETDRVFAIKNELAKMGIHVEATENTLKIYGGNPHAATIDTYNDHRMAMAFAVAGTRLAGMNIEHPDVVNKTFPGFWKRLQQIGIKYHNG